MANRPTEKSARDRRQAMFTVGVFAVAVFIVFFFARFPPSRQTALLNQAAPNIELKLSSGTWTSLEAYRGKVVLINFWASWCAPCMEEMGTLRELEEQLGPSGLELLAINIDGENPNVLGSFPQDRLPRNLIFGFSESSLLAYQVSTIPLSILIDRDGVIRNVFIGPRNWTGKPVMQAIERFL